MKVLFVCQRNSARSPMAAALAQAAGIDAVSAGVDPGPPDAFMPAVMLELGHDLLDHDPQGLDAVDFDDFDRIIALSPRAADELAEILGPDTVNYWDVPNPESDTGRRDQIIASYREVRDAIAEKVATLGKG